MTLDRNALRNPLALVVGLLALGCGTVGLLGWHTGDPALTQVLPELMPLSCSASLFLVGLGIGWLAAIARFVWLSIALGIALFVYGLVATMPGFEATLLRTLNPWVVPSATFHTDPTDFSALTAMLAFGLAGLMILRNTHPSSIVGAAASLPLFGLAVVGFQQTSLPWGMGIAAVGFSLSGLFDVRLPRGSNLAMAIRVIPILLVTASTLATVLLWRAVSEAEQIRTMHLIEAEADGVMQQIRTGFPNTLQRFDDLAKTWHRNATDLAEKHITAGGLMGSVRSSVVTYWIDSEGHIEWIETGSRFQRLRTFIDEERSDRLRQFVDAARKTDEWSIGIEPLPIGNSSYHLLLTFFPSPARDRSGILVVFSAPELFGSIFTDYHQTGNLVEVRESESLLFQRGQSTDWMARIPPQEFSYSPLRSVEWSVRIWPTQSLLARERSTMAVSTLLSGLVMTGFLGLTSYLFLRSRAQARRVAQSDARSQSLISNLQQAVYLKDQELRYVSVNRVFCDQVGRTEGEILGKSDEELYAPEVALGIRREEELILSEGIRREREETVGIAGKSHLVQVMRSPVRDASGRVSGVLGVCWDVTDQRRLETQLRQSQKMDALGKLAGGIAHDFNNLLTVMIGNLYLMRDDHLSSEDSNGLIQEAEKAANRAAELVRQLLSFSRQTPIRFEPVSVPSVVAEVVRLVRRTIDAKIQIEAIADDDLWPIQGDVGQLHQVLMNLCINARDAMPDHGVLRVSACNQILGPNQLAGRLEAREGEFVRLSVTDDGTGMTPEVRSRIFEPFFTTKGLGKGTGLGLAQVFGIAQQHQGWIECRSTLGVGTTFDLYFPRSVEVGESSCSVAQTIRSGSETILVIDDESMIRNLVKRIFTTAGYRVLSASDGKEGIDLYRSHSDVDLILLDLNMPGLSGQETFRELLRVDPRVRVVISSGYSEEHLDAHEANLVSAFLAKPFRRDDLLRVVREVLDSSSTPSVIENASTGETVLN